MQGHHERITPDIELLEPKFEKIATCRVYLGNLCVVRKIKIPAHKDIVNSNIYAEMGKPYNTNTEFSGVAIFLQSNTSQEAKEALHFIDQNIIYEAS